MGLGRCLHRLLYGWHACRHTCCPHPPPSAFRVQRVERFDENTKKWVKAHVAHDYGIAAHPTGQVSISCLHPHRVTYQLGSKVWYFVELGGHSLKIPPFPPNVPPSPFSVPTIRRALLHGKPIPLAAFQQYAGPAGNFGGVDLAAILPFLFPSASCPATLEVVYARGAPRVVTWGRETMEGYHASQCQPLPVQTQSTPANPPPA